MAYKVVLTPDAEEELNQFIRYLLYEKKNEQAASNVLDDFEATVQSLSRVAGRLKLCDHPRLRALGYRKIHFNAQVFHAVPNGGGPRGRGWHLS